MDTSRQVTEGGYGTFWNSIITDTERCMHAVPAVDGNKYCMQVEKENILVNTLTSCENSRKYRHGVWEFS